MVAEKFQHILNYLSDNRKDSKGPNVVPVKPVPALLSCKRKSIDQKVRERQEEVTKYLVHRHRKLSQSVGLVCSDEVSKEHDKRGGFLPKITGFGERRARCNMGKLWL